MSRTVRSEFRNLAHKNAQMGSAGPHTSKKYRRENREAVRDALAEEEIIEATHIE
jgi:hypothetical protein